jgi:hypothetical protein
VANADDVQRDPPAERHVASPFTHVEDLIISSWLARTRQKFRLRNLSDASPKQRPLADALASLGLAHDPKQYDRLDAAVGQILLRDIVGRLPRLNNWRGCRGRSSARAEKHRSKSGSLHFAPQHLFTIVWPSQTLALTGPVAYFRVWVPGFNRFVVTASEPTDGPHGYCDFALGSFANVPEWQGLAGQIIHSDWLTQFGFWWCKHRAEVSASGIVSVELADQLAERAWVTEHRVFYSKKLTPQAPRAIRSGLLPVKRSLSARVLTFRRHSKDPLIDNSNGDST